MSKKVFTYDIDNFESSGDVERLMGVITKNIPVNNIHVINDAIQALLRLEGKEKMEPVLIKLLKDPENEDIYLILVDALSEIKGKRSRRAAQKILLDTSYERHIRKGAAQLLGNIGNIDSLLILEKTSRETEKSSYVNLNNPSVGKTAAEAYSKLKTRLDELDPEQEEKPGGVLDRIQDFFARIHF
jgi:hypothetical protein